MVIYVELISQDEVNLPFRAGDLKISKLHLGKAVMAKLKVLPGLSKKNRT